jgi:hypothetical protein
MSKRELIDKIKRINRTAREDFLEAFSPHELDDYLRQLETIDRKGPHIRVRKRNQP